MFLLQIENILLYSVFYLKSIDYPKTLWVKVSASLYWYFTTTMFHWKGWKSTILDSTWNRWASSSCKEDCKWITRSMYLFLTWMWRIHVSYESNSNWWSWSQCIFHFRYHFHSIIHTIGSVLVINTGVLDHFQHLYENGTIHNIEEVRVYLSSHS